MTNKPRKRKNTLPVRWKKSAFGRASNMLGAIRRAIFVGKTTPKKPAGKPKRQMVEVNINILSDSGKLTSIDYETIEQ